MGGMQITARKMDIKTGMMRSPEVLKPAMTMTNAAALIKNRELFFLTSPASEVFKTGFLIRVDPETRLGLV